MIKSILEIWNYIVSLNVRYGAKFIIALCFGTVLFTVFGVPYIWKEKQRNNMITDDHAKIIEFAIQIKAQWGFYQNLYKFIDSTNSEQTMQFAMMIDRHERKTDEKMILILNSTNATKDIIKSMIEQDIKDKEEVINNRKYSIKVTKINTP